MVIHNSLILACLIFQKEAGFWALFSYLAARCCSLRDWGA